MGGEDIYLRTFPHSLPDELCDEIVGRFERSVDLQRVGVTQKGADARTKDTMDINLTSQSAVEWREIEAVLRSELKARLGVYLGEIAASHAAGAGKPLAKLDTIDTLCAPRLTFQIQRYRKGQGKYIYHTDGRTVESGSSRLVTYLWYLNDVTEGGETEVWGGGAKIVPEKGKLLLFPAEWTYPHRGNMPVSGDKYIVTGWIYTSPPNRICGEKGMGGSI